MLPGLAGLAPAPRPDVGAYLVRNAAGGGEPAFSDSLSSLTAVQCYERDLAQTLRVSQSDKPRAAQVRKCFDMCLRGVDERELVHSRDPRDDVAKQRLFYALHDRLIGRLILSFTDAGQQAPRDLVNFKTLGSTAVPNRLLKLKSFGALCGAHVLTDALSHAEFARLPLRPETSEAPSAAKAARTDDGGRDGGRGRGGGGGGRARGSRGGGRGSRGRRGAARG